MTNVGEAWYDIDARTNKLRGKLDDADARIKTTGDRAGKNLTSRLTSGLGAMGGIVGGMAKVAAAGGLIVGGAFAVLGGLAVKGAADAESMRASWEVLLGSVEKAQERTEELKQFAATTPFEIPEVMAASRTLQVFGGDAIATGENLRMVGDIASGVQQPFEDVAMWIGRTYDAMKSGQPFGEAAMRLQEMGALSGEGRKRLEELAKASKDGSITMEEAWSGAQEVFSQFSGGMERQSQTLNGQISNLMDNIGQSLAGVGEILLPVVKNIVEGFNEALPTIRETLINVFEAAAPVMSAVGDVIGDILYSIGQLAGFLSGGEMFEDAFFGFGMEVKAIVEAVQQFANDVLPHLLSVGKSVFEGIAEAIGWIAANVLPDLIALLGAVLGWFEDNGPAIATIVGGIVDTFVDLYEGLRPVAETMLPILGDALGAVVSFLADNWPVVSEILKGIAVLLTGVFGFRMVTSIITFAQTVRTSLLTTVIPSLVATGTAVTVALGPVGLIIAGIALVVAAVAAAWATDFLGMRSVIETVVGAIIGFVEGVVGFFTDTFIPAIEGIGRTWGEIWEAVGGFFEGLWNGILQFFGGVVGTIIGVIASVAEAASMIPGPWQEGAKATAKALRGMEADAKTWGTTTASTLRTSYDTMREDARAGGAGTGRAWGEGFRGVGDAIAQDVATGLQGAREVLQAFSPPRDPRNPLKNIAVFAARTADAYGDAFASRAARIAALVGSTLAPAADFLKPDGASFVGSNTRIVDARLDVVISGDPAAIAALPGGAAGVAAELRRGIDATGFLRSLRHEAAIR